MRSHELFSVCREEVAKELRSALSHIKLSSEGVYVQASTLGSLEALLDFLKSSKIPVSFPFFPCNLIVSGQPPVYNWNHQLMIMKEWPRRTLPLYTPTEWMISARVFFFMRFYFYIDRCVTYCVRSKLTISSILSLNWLKEEVAYWLKCTYSTSVRTKCSRIHNTLEK